MTCVRGSQYSSNFARTSSIVESSSVSPHSKASKAILASSPITDNNVETLTSCSCLFTPVATSYLVHAFFHAFQLVAKLLSITSGLGVGASLQAACRFEWWVIFLELASLLHERSMLQVTL